MERISRRSFVAATATLVPATQALFADALRRNDLGVQLYTVRDVILGNPLGILKGIQNIGYTEVEAIYAMLPQIDAALQQTKLKAVSVHVDTDVFMSGGAKLEDVLSDIKRRGFQYVVVPYIPPSERGGADMFHNLAAKLNFAGERAQSHGLKLCYHNHAFEYQPLGDTTGLEILMSQTHKDLVSLELDVFWATIGGHNPVDLLKKYSGRVPLVHLKDKAREFTATQYNENVPENTFVTVGSGSINFPAVLAAADSAGAKHYFVEQDHTAGDPMIALRQSYMYLKTQFGE
jgi:sugar phosphate isomerase/epimerase